MLWLCPGDVVGRGCFGSDGVILKQPVGIINQLVDWSTELSIDNGDSKDSKDAVLRPSC